MLWSSGLPRRHWLWPQFWFCHPRKLYNIDICDVQLFIPSLYTASNYSYLHRSFAIGLGPIPFVIIPEVSPPHVRS